LVKLYNIPKIKGFSTTKDPFKKVRDKVEAKVRKVTKKKKAK